MTPLPVIAKVCQVVSKTLDQVIGGRGDTPLLVATACAEALKSLNIGAQVWYGKAAWVEVLDDQSAVWAGAWGAEEFHFWTVTEFHETVDLYVSQSSKKKGVHPLGELKPLYSPPILWSSEIPKFYRYHSEGIAEIDRDAAEAGAYLEKILERIRKHCRPELLDEAAPQFPNESIICPDRKLMDDIQGSFRFYERAILVHGIPAAPF